MELQFEKQELVCLDQVVRAVKDQELTQEIRLTDAMPDVGRVLAGWGQVILRGKEWQGSRMSAAGGVMAWVLYAPEDGTEPRVVDAWLPFQVKWDGVEAEREGPMRMMPLLRFVDGRNLSARKILIRVGLQCLGEGYVQRRQDVFSAVEVPADVELLRRSYPVRLPCEAGEKTFDLEEMLDVGNPALQEIISYSLTPELAECRVTGDKMVLRGTGKLHLVYRCMEGRIRTRNFEMPFSQLAELEGMYEDGTQADGLLAVTGLEVDMAEDKLRLRGGLVAQYLIARRQMLELVEDAYSPRREVGLRQEELYLPVILDETQERIGAQGEISAAGEPAEGVFWPGFPQARRDGDRVELTVPGRFQLLMREVDGSYRGATAQWEGRTGLDADEMSRIDAVILPAGEPQWIVGGSGTEMRAETQLRMTAVSRQGMPMITGLEIGELRPADRTRPSLILCRTGGRSLWNLARACGSSVSAIRDANNLEEEPEAGRMLLIPVT